MNSFQWSVQGIDIDANINIDYKNSEPVFEKWQKKQNILKHTKHFNSFGWIVTKVSIDCLCNDAFIKEYAIFRILGKMRA